MVVRIATLDEWSFVSWSVFVGFVATAWRDRDPAPTVRAIFLGVTFFAALGGAVAYLPDLWFGIAYRLNHAEHYLWNANGLMRALPGNSGRFIWEHRTAGVTAFLKWIYLTGFDMVVWIPVVRALVALDPRKMVRYALSAHVIQFPLIIPFYTAIRVDEVWSVVGDADRCGRGWSDEVRRDLGANCFPSMHTSVAFAIFLVSIRERSAVFRVGMATYAGLIILSTVYMEIHWLADVAGGLLLGAGSVKIVDWLLAPRAPTQTVLRAR